MVCSTCFYHLLIMQFFFCVCVCDVTMQLVFLFRFTVLQASNGTVISVTYPEEESVSHSVTALKKSVAQMLSITNNDVGAINNYRGLIN